MSANTASPATSTQPSSCPQRALVSRDAPHIERDGSFGSEMPENIAAREAGLYERIRQLENRKKELDEAWSKSVEEEKRLFQDRCGRNTRRRSTYDGEEGRIVEKRRSAGHSEGELDEEDDDSDDDIIWEKMEGNGVCDRCQRMEVECYRDITRLRGATSHGARVLPGTSCQRCRRVKLKCSAERKIRPGVGNKRKLAELDGKGKGSSRKRGRGSATREIENLGEVLSALESLIQDQKATQVMLKDVQKRMESQRAKQETLLFVVHRIIVEDSKTSRTNSVECDSDYASEGGDYQTD